MIQDKAFRKYLILLCLLAASYLISACGLSDGSPNAGTPSGTLIATGTLAPANGTTTASGTVNVYDQGEGLFVVQISGIVFSGSSCGSVLTVGANIGGTYVSSSSITIFSGTQNFTFSTNATGWAQVYFHCQGGLPAPTGDDAVAQLFAPA